MPETKVGGYRKDIDGMRAIAVLAVILFHIGFLPNGYLGVDVFFAISGFLITKIIYNELLQNRFSVSNFYVRRIRRIIPLVLFTSLSALIIGLFVMLPDDLENLSQSVFATNVFANNILLWITSGDYWSVVNEFKPLMHTWSLGIEEQFYVLYPLIFLVLPGKRSRFIAPLLLVLTLISLGWFLFSNQEASKFYFIQYRFFELSLGGFGAIVFRIKPIHHVYKPFMMGVILAILLFDFGITADLKLLIVVFSSVGLLIAGEKNATLGSFLLENRWMVGIGKISFSLYMWHQIVLAYTRYFVTKDIGVLESIVLFMIVLGLSVFSYYTIEQPFRNKEKVPTNRLIWITGVAFMLVSISSLYVYHIGGIIRDVPELELYASDRKMNVGSRERNIHIAYNAQIYDFDKAFSAHSEKVKVLVIGNSFARDFVNVLLESNVAPQMEISYVYDVHNSKDLNERLQQAKFVFFSDLEMSEFEELKQKFTIETEKVWMVGPKNFGTNNGIFYNNKSHDDYCFQRTHLDLNFIERNQKLKEQWGNKYIDLLNVVLDQDGTVPVFTPDCKFISQDCKHFTPAGAVYFAHLLDLNRVFQE